MTVLDVDFEAAECEALDCEAGVFEKYRANLLGIAYRIVGCRAEAEDIVHDVYLKWSKIDQSSLKSPKHWLARVVTNQSLDVLKSARVQRESYIGPWLPEPFVDAKPTMEEEKSLDQTVSMALLMLLERLSPSERAVFILHDIFHFSFDEIADILETAPTTCRKQASRARGKVNKDAIRQEISHHEHENYVQVFFEAVKHGDFSGLTHMLKEDVVLYSDGGGKAAAAPTPIVGVRKVANFLLHYVRPNFETSEDGQFRTSLCKFNGAPGLLVTALKEGKQQVVTAFQLAIVDNKIKHIFAHRNPDKLKYFEMN